MMKPNPGEVGSHPKGHQPPAPAASPGPERKADTGGAIMGSPTDGLAGAVSELKTQHPIAHHDHGPHHGRQDHVRHQPVGKVYDR